jgi:hypothetical protein
MNNMPPPFTRHHAAKAEARGRRHSPGRRFAELPGEGCRNGYRSSTPEVLKKPLLRII